MPKGCRPRVIADIANTESCYLTGSVNAESLSECAEGGEADV
jgi:hypothetical protein